MEHKVLHKVVARFYFLGNGGMEKFTAQVSCLIQFNYFKQKGKKKKKARGRWGGNSLELKSQCYYQFKFSFSVPSLWMEPDLMKQSCFTCCCVCARVHWKLYLIYPTFFNLRQKQIELNHTILKIIILCLNNKYYLHEWTFQRAELFAAYLWIKFWKEYQVTGYLKHIVRKTFAKVTPVISVGLWAQRRGSSVGVTDRMGWSQEMCSALCRIIPALWNSWEGSGQGLVPTTASLALGSAPGNPSSENRKSFASKALK